MDKTTLYAVVGLILLGIGFTMNGFAIWQKDLLFVARMWSPCQTNIQFYQDLLARGYGSWSQMPFTINVWLFPNMVAGQAYDLCDIMGWGSWFFTAIGAFLLHTPIVAVAKKIRSLLSGNRL